MKKSNYTEEQIAFALKQAELGAPISELCRKLGIAELTFYRWKSKYGGMLPSDMKRLRQLEEENAKLKKLVANLSLDKLMLQDILTKNSKACREADAVRYLQERFQASERKSCMVLRINRGWHRRQPTRDEQAFLRMRIREITLVRKRYGYRRIHVLLLREGWKINHKRVYRLYRQEGLNLRKPSSRKKISVSRAPEKGLASAVNECWCMDFVSDQLYNRKRFRALTVLDTFSRESLAIYVDKSIKGEQVCDELEKIKAARELPQRIKVDNGPEFISRTLDAWAYFNKVKLDYSRPGTPTDNPHIESFNGSFRDECLNMNWFMSLEDARDKVERWRRDYNEFRPHSALTYLTPAEFARKSGSEAV